MSRETRCCVVGIGTGNRALSANGKMPKASSLESNGLRRRFEEDNQPSLLRDVTVPEGESAKSSTNQTSPSEGDNTKDGSSYPFPTQTNGQGKIGGHNTPPLSLSDSSTTHPTPSETTPPDTSSPPSPSPSSTTPNPPLSLTTHRRAPTARKGKFADLVFTATSTTFDRQNSSAARDSPFHGFFTLFWMGVFLFVVKIGADNWRRHGSVLGTNEIMRRMFADREVVVLLLADGGMCAMTGVGWAWQVMVARGGVEW